MSAKTNLEVSHGIESEISAIPLADKAYVGVYTYTKPDGCIFPYRIRWKDDREWEIDRILDSHPGVAY